MLFILLESCSRKESWWLIGFGERFASNFVPLWYGTPLAHSKPQLRFRHFLQGDLSIKCSPPPILVSPVTNTYTNNWHGIQDFSLESLNGNPDFADALKVALITIYCMQVGEVRGVLFFKLLKLSEFYHMTCSVRNRRCVKCCLPPCITKTLECNERYNNGLAWQEDIQILTKASCVNEESFYPASRSSRRSTGSSWEGGEGMLVMCPTRCHLVWSFPWLLAHIERSLYKDFNSCNDEVKKACLLEARSEKAD